MRSLWVKRLLGRFFGFLARKEPRRVVLLYHAVGKGPEACAADRFGEQMDWLSQHARVLPLDALIEDRDPAPLQVAITFDDGYASVAENAAPIMSRYGFTGTVYLTTACVGSEEASRRVSDPELGHLSGERFMIWPEISALQEAGWRIGSHGLDHLDMTTLRPEELRDQLEDSKMLIESHLGVFCDAFAYPWGRNNEIARKAVGDAGYANAAGTLHGPLRKKSNRLAFPRVDIRRDYDIGDLERVLRGDWDFLGAFQSFRARRFVRD